MENEVRTPDGEIRQISLTPSEGGLYYEQMSFEPAGGDSLWFTDVYGGRREVRLAKVGDTWWIHLDGHAWKVDIIEAGSDGDAGNDSSLSAPMPGTILEVLVREGEQVSAGQALLVMEAMKMEHRITAPNDGVVAAIHFAQGERCDQGAALVTIE